MTKRIDNRMDYVTRLTQVDNFHFVMFSNLICFSYLLRKTMESIPLFLIIILFFAEIKSLVFSWLVQFVVVEEQVGFGNLNRVAWPHSSLTASKICNYITFESKRSYRCFAAWQMITLSSWHDVQLLVRKLILLFLRKTIIKAILGGIIRVWQAPLSDIRNKFLSATWIKKHRLTIIISNLESSNW